MLDYLAKMKNENWDCLSFFEGDDENKISITGSRYKNPGEYEIGQNKGQIYHIILVKDHEENPAKFDHFDKFEAVLLDPLEYVSGLIPSGWYGLVAKKTTNSHKFVDETIDKMKKFL